MSQTLGARATSVAASAVLLGLVVFAAFSVTISLQTDNGQTPMSFPVVPLAPDEPTPPPVTRDPQPPQQEPVEDDFQVVNTPIQTLPPTPDFSGLTTVSSPPVGPASITNPRWLRQPRNLQRYYPARAVEREITGQVVLDCMVSVLGALDCSVVSETPANWGFGEAAVRISEDYRMAPAMRDGVAVEGRYRMRVPFELD